MVPRVFSAAIVGCDLSVFLFFEVETVLFFLSSLMMVNNGDFGDSFGEEKGKSAISVGVSRNRTCGSLSSSYISLSLQNFGAEFVCWNSVNEE